MMENYTGEYMKPKEIEEMFPLMTKLFYPKLPQIKRISGPGMCGATMLFAPEIERLLERAIKEKLWDEFKLQVSFKRNRKSSK